MHGILTANTLCRRVPSHLRAFTVNFSWWIDAFQRRPLETGMPVAVLHMSKNRDWYYVNTEICFGWVMPDAEVSVGFLPFTQRNMINTVFTLLNRPYRGGGGEHERDCDGTVRTVLKVFGIINSSIPTATATMKAMVPRCVLRG